MVVYGITEGFEVIPVLMGSSEMMECLMVEFDYEEALIAANELKNSDESGNL